jgi:phosphate transport system substrate-binding protein
MNIGTRIKNLFKDMWNNTEAVSPIVATLVLVTVAIAGAAGVGMIQGTFSSQVSEDASAGGAASSASTEILIAGSTTVQPVSDLLGEWYMVQHPGVKVTVQAGGSGAGITSTGLGIVDIGSASKDLDDDDMKAYPTLQPHKIGGSAVVVIMKGGMQGNISKAELIRVYDGKHDSPTGLVELNFNATSGVITCNETCNVTNTTYTVYDRAESSGTEDTFSDYLFDDKGEINDVAAATGATGNAGMLSAVAGNAHSIGFVDYGFADDSVNITGVAGYDHPDITSKKIKKELQLEDGVNYVTGLTRPLNYITLGEPSALEQSFIDFATTPGSTEDVGSAYWCFDQCGYFPVVGISS